MRRALSLPLVFVLACDAGDKPKAAAPVPASPAAAAVSVDLADPLALLPADSDVVIEIDGAVLRKSPLFGKYRNFIRDFVVPGFADCKYDPLDDIETVRVAIPTATEMGMFVFRGLDRDKTLSCLRTSKVETKTDVTFDGDIISLRNKSGALNLLTFVGPKTAVMQGSKNPTKESLTAALKAGAPLRSDKDFVAAWDKRAPNAAISIVSRPGSQAFGEMMSQKLGAPVRALRTSVVADDKMSATFELELVNAGDAAATVENMKPMLGQMRALVDRYDIKADGAKVIVDIVATEAQIQQFVDLAKGMMGGR